MTAATTLITAAELRKMKDIGRCEVLYGELVMTSPAGAEHGVVALRIGRFLGEFVERNGLGIVLAAATGFLLEQKPDLLVAPDVSFVRRSRIVNGLPKGFFKGVPDIAVEVVSPGDTQRKVAEEVNVWLAHGTSSVWVADPATMTIMLHRTGQPARRFPVGKEFVDEAVLPGFSMSVARVFMMP
ncbi:MAG: Uma2 family endonuclease [Tepidisphaeraceae bacterium]|jgi:Uma2 family endonuclease